MSAALPPSRSSVRVRAVTEGPIFPLLLSLGLPAMAGKLARGVQNLVDGKVAGGLGADDLAGLTGGTFFLWMVFSFAETVTVGTNALIARFVGARDPDMALRVARSTMLGGVLWSLLLGLGLYLSAPFAIGLLGLKGAAAVAATQYLHVLSAGLVALFIYQNIEAVFRGSGDTRTPMALLFLTIAVNLGAVVPLVKFFGVGGLPLATYLALGVACAPGYRILKKRGLLATPAPRAGEGAKAPVVDWKLFYEACRIGGPVALYGVFFSLVYMWLSRIVTPFGNGALAALGLGHRVESVTYLVAVGFSYAVATLVGQNLGAKKPERAAKAAWIATGLCVAYALVTGTLMFFYATDIALAFIDDPAALRPAEQYLKIIAFSQWAMTVEIILDSAFGGAGDSMPPMLAGVPLAILRVPLAWYLSTTLGWGEAGVWWAISSTTVAKGVVTAAWFSLGHWKTKLDERLKADGVTGQ